MPSENPFPDPSSLPADICPPGNGHVPIPTHNSSSKIAITSPLSIWRFSSSNSTDSTTANADNDFRAYGISYAVSEDLSISYNVASTDYENTTLEDQDSSGMSFSYTNGSVTLSGSMNEVDNIQGTSATDNTGYELNIAFAF